MIEFAIVSFMHKRVQLAIGGRDHVFFFDVHACAGGLVEGIKLVIGVELFLVDDWLLRIMTLLQAEHVE